VQAPDQRFLVPALVEGAGFSGVFSRPSQSCARMRMQDVRDEMWLVSCGFEPAGTSMSSPEALLRVHA
jgi:hypothetical protein